MFKFADALFGRSIILGVCDRQIWHSRGYYFGPVSIHANRNDRNNLSMYTNSTPIFLNKSELYGAILGDFARTKYFLSNHYFHCTSSRWWMMSPLSMISRMTISTWPPCTHPIAPKVKEMRWNATIHWRAAATVERQTQSYQ